MANDQPISTTTTPSPRPEGSGSSKPGQSPQDKLMDSLPGASAPAENEAEGEGEGDGTLGDEVEKGDGEGI